MTGVWSKGARRTQGVATRWALTRIIAYNDPDREWVERVLVGYLDGTYDIQIRSLAVTCLGHVARIRHGIDRELVLSLFEPLLQEREIAGLVEDDGEFASRILPVRTTAA